MKVTQRTLQGLPGAEEAEQFIFIIKPQGLNPKPSDELGGTHLREADEIRQFLLKLPWGTVKALIESHPFSQLIPKH